MSQEHADDTDLADVRRFYRFIQKKSACIYKICVICVPNQHSLIIRFASAAAASAVAASA